MLPIAENLSDYIVSSFEIRQYSCIPRLHKRKNFLAMGQRFCKKTALFSGAARRARNTNVLWAEGNNAETKAVSSKKHCTLIVLSTNKKEADFAN